MSGVHGFFQVPNPFELSRRLNTRKSKLSSKRGSHPIVFAKKNTSKPPRSNCPQVSDPSEKLTPSILAHLLSQGTKKATVSFPNHPLRMSFVKTGCLRLNFDQLACSSALGAMSTGARMVSGDDFDRKIRQLRFDFFQPLRFKEVVFCLDM